MPTITGTSDSDTLVGTSDPDELFGLAGDDIIDGGGGADRMDGGTGDDLFIVDDAGDVVIERSGEGIDTVRSSISYELAANVENLVLTGNAAINGEGNSLNNRITGNDAANVIRGGGGSDVFIGGGGNDHYVVVGTVAEVEGGYAFGGLDQVVEEAGGGIDTVTSNISFTLGANVENLRLTGSLDLSGFGNAEDNRIIGNSGRNFIQGGDGNDYLDGGAGADSLHGGAGDDTYVIDHVDDHLGIESPDESGGIDTVRSSVSHTLEFSFEHLVLTGTGAINGIGNHRDNAMVGNSAANVLDGGSGNDRIEGAGGNDTITAGFGIDIVIGGAGNDVIDGGPGTDRIYGNDGDDVLNGGFDADKMYGGAGNDSYIVDHKSDWIYEKTGEGMDSVAASVSYALNSGVENLTLTGSMAINAVGNGLANQLTGNGAVNILTGRAGDDTLLGLGGNDTLRGDEGADTLIGGAGRDRMTGGADADLFVFADGDFAGTSSSTCDQIFDFSQAEGDLIDLGLADANSVLGGDQGFAFIGNSGFSGTAGELRYVHSGGNTYVQADTDGDGQTDLMIRLDGMHTLTSGDFIL